MNVINQERLDLHEKYANGEEDGIRLVLEPGPVSIEVSLVGANLRSAILSGAILRSANLSDANLSDADLRSANLSDAILSDAILSGAILRSAILSGAILSGAILRSAILRGANLRGANLSDADLSDADLRSANLSDADLSDADLRSANLSDAKNIPDYVVAVTNILPEGDVIGWKKLANGDIGKLLIRKDTPRSNATGRKCRTQAADVLMVYDKDGNEIAEGVSMRDSKFVYRVGETVSVPDFDPDRWNECSTGIHFFITRFEAEQYE